MKFKHSIKLFFENIFSNACDSENLITFAARNEKVERFGCLQPR